MKYLILLILGIAIGYAYGFSDAKAHEKNVVARMVSKVGGSHRDNFSGDIDKKVERSNR